MLKNIYDVYPIYNIGIYSVLFPTAINKNHQPSFRKNIAPDTINKPAIDYTAIICYVGHLNMSVA